jgi:hypothetical protein
MFVDKEHTLEARHAPDDRCSIGPGIVLTAALSALLPRSGIGAPSRIPISSRKHCGVRWH